MTARDGYEIRKGMARQLRMEYAGALYHNAYVILPNHYHLALETPEANLVAGMRWLQNTYTRRYNTRHKQWGHVFGGRYKSLVVDGGDVKYFRCLLEYIHITVNCCWRR